MPSSPFLPMTPSLTYSYPSAQPPAESLSPVDDLSYLKKLEKHPQPGKHRRKGKEKSVTICPYSFVFLDLLFFSRDYSSTHFIGPLTTLVFVIASFHPLHRTSLTHFRLLLCTSSRFHRIPPCSFCFVVVPELSESQVYKPSTRYIFP